MDSKYITIEKETDIFNGFFGFKQFFLRYKRFDGRMSDVVNREMFIAKKAVSVIPYDPINDKIILVEQVRFASSYMGGETYVKEFPAGIIDNPETDSPTDTAIRELQEETGLKKEGIKDIISIYDYMPSPGCMAEKVWLLCGIVDVNKAASFGGLEDEGEDIKVHIISFDDGVKMLKNNEIHNANTVVGMQWLILNREYLRNKYQ